ncbi:MAG: exopolysaccharide biosynthesis GT4 family glycosyltransferase EpsE, partial [Pseudomonadota bacterium]
ARTTYLASRSPADALRAIPRQKWLRLAGQMLREGAGFAKDVAICLPAATRLVAYARQHRMQHIHVHSCGRAALVAAFAKRMGGPDYSVTLHGPLSDYGPGQRIKWQDARFATVITRKLMGEIEAELGPHLPGDIRLRPMGVDTEALKRTAPYMPAQQGEPLRIFSCARLNIVKGHQDLMQATRHLLDRGVDVRVEIAGEDDAGGTGFRAELETRLKELHLQNHVTLLGAIDADTVRAKLLDAHLFVLASWHEPLGVAYMEAMSCEVPTIGTASGGVPEMITSGETAILVPPKSPDALADAIADLARDPDTARRLSTAGRDHIIANYRSALGAETLIDAIWGTAD